VSAVLDPPARPPALPGRAPAALARRAPARPAERLAALAIVVLAAALRFAGLGRTPLNPFYDAAVRSMGTSWHAFLVGAFDPSARLAIDKPPVDLWLQVASTKLFGFTPGALLAPVALGGTLAVAALYDLLRTLLGPRVALAGALVLAVFPVAVITSRSDTMDSVMAALLIAALAVAARGVRAGRTRNVVLAGALLGAAFEVKLFEALIGAVPLALLWWLGAPLTRRRRLAGLAGAAAACVAVGLAWLVALTVLVAPHDRPWAFGAGDGSAWTATFVYDGLERVTGLRPPPVPVARDRTPPRPPAALAAARRHQGNARRAAALRAPAGPGPLRLLSSQAHLDTRLAPVLIAAWLALLGLGAVLARGRLRLGRVERAGLAALAAWLALGTLLFSLQRGLRPRYLEAFDPAVAAILGAGVVLVAGAVAARLGARRPRAVRVAPLAAAAVLVAALAAPAATSVHAVATHVQDSGAPGGLPSRRLATLSAFLRARQGAARYEVASVAVAKAGPVIARDGRPVLMLTGTWGRPLVSTAQLARLVASGAVRTALVGDNCTRLSTNPWVGCSAPARWIRAHGVDVSRAAGQPHAGFVYALGAGAVPRPRVLPRVSLRPAPRRGTRSGSARSAASRRRASASPRRASRARHRRRDRAR
jgi:4-amino-4-deoxy-L-arabinose transferase-like glycosyltransferase